MANNLLIDVPETSWPRSPSSPLPYQPWLTTLKDFHNLIPLLNGCGCCLRSIHWTTFPWDPSLSGMICEHWWDLWCFIFPIPNSRGVKDIADNHIRQKIGKVVFTFTSRDQGWEENFELRVYFWPSGNIDVFLWRPSPRHWTWFDADIWRPVPTSRESDSRLRHQSLSNRWCTFQRMSACQLLGEISADVLLMIMTNESSVIPDDYMSLDGIGIASIPLNDPGFLGPSICFCREGHSHKVCLEPHGCCESCLKPCRIYLFCIALRVGLNL